MKYTLTTLKEELAIQQIVTIHYFEFVKDYRFAGEQHNFWEFLYVDRGALLVTAGEREHTLTKGDIIFHKPNEWHNNVANGLIGPNVMVVSFVCDSPCMRFFENRVVQISDYEKDLLATILREAGDAFSAPFNDPYTTCLVRKPHPAFASEQMIKLCLEMMMLHIIREHTPLAHRPRLSTSVRENSEKEILRKILVYLEKNVRGKINLDDVCAYTMFSRSYIQRLFKSHMGTSIMDYYKHLKIEEAKLMIREGRYNFTQISELLSYASIHHFSRHFKEITNMTPSEYASSVKIKV